MAHNAKKSPLSDLIMDESKMEEAKKLSMAEMMADVRKRAEAAEAAEDGDPEDPKPIITEIPSSVPYRVPGYSMSGTMRGVYAPQPNTTNEDLIPVRKHEANLSDLALKIRYDARCFGCFRFLMHENRIRPREDEVGTLSLCSGCKLVSFCSEKCQSKNFEEHKAACSYAKNLQAEIHELETAKKYRHADILKPKPIKPEDIAEHKGCKQVCKSYNPKANKHEPDNIFLKYVYKKQCLIYCLWYFADNSNDLILFEQVKEKIVEIMKMSAFGLCEMRSFLVMALINLGQEKDAYNVIKFWMTTFRKANPDAIARMINSLGPREWLHAKDSDCFDTIHDNFRPQDKPSIRLSGFIAALAFIKIKEMKNLSAPTKDKETQFTNFIGSLMVKLHDYQLVAMLIEGGVVCDCPITHEFPEFLFNFKFENHLKYLKKHGKEAIPYVEARRIWYAFARHPDVRKTIIDGAALKTQMQLSEAKENGLLEKLGYGDLPFTKEKFEAFVKDDPLGAHYATLQANAELALDKLPKMHI